ncbi:MAG TPA: type II toxin-antitoxin system VapC family toxin [Alphaproteobacteria bacterium]|nr:type II toxin-antitoxin system VapC family toxin [Alphaproteobacteria bacterium]
MMIPDVNVLINAFRTDAEQHALCRRWLTDLANGEGRFGVSPLTLSALVRITTQRRFYQAPSTLQEAFAFCTVLLEQPNCEIVEPGERHWDIFESLCRDTNTRGARVTDAWFAALALEKSCEWITLDRDYARFPGLKWSIPQDGSA